MTTVAPKDTLQPIHLPPPAEVGAISLHEAFARRCTIRDIAASPLSLAQLSNLLWAACGLNRRQGPAGRPGRTAASASNSQEIDIYVALADGIYLFDAMAHSLQPVAAGDLRSDALNPRQGASSMAPVHLIYVADLHRLTHTIGHPEPGLHDPEIQKSYYFVDTGMIAGNVYLFAAGHGLASWFHNCDKATLAARLGLRSEQRVLFAQSVGWPAGTDEHAS